MEDHHIVHAVEKFGTEVLAQHLHHAFRGVSEGGFVLQRIAGQESCPQVRGHDQDRIFEVHHAALRVREPPVVEHLQQHVEDIRMRLLDFIEQNDRVRAPADGFRELSALVVTHVTGRCADHASHGMFFHVLAHVEADHRLLIVEEKLSQRAGGFRLADARWPEEDERPDGPLGIAEAGARTANGIRHHAQRRVLSDHALLQPLLHPDQLFDFAFEHARDRDPGPLADDPCDVFLVDFFLQHARGAALAILQRVEPLHFGFQFRKLAILNLRRALKVAAPRLLVGFETQRLDLLFQVAQPGDGLALFRPARPQSRGLFAELRHFALHVFEALF